MTSRNIFLLVNNFQQLYIMLSCKHNKEEKKLDSIIRKRESQIRLSVREKVRFGYQEERKFDSVIRKRKSQIRLSGREKVRFGYQKERKLDSVIRQLPVYRQVHSVVIWLTVLPSVRKTLLAVGARFKSFRASDKTSLFPQQQVRHHCQILKSAVTYKPIMSVVKCRALS